MLQWSRYNLLFKSEKFGYLLYNSLSNSLAAIEDAAAAEMKQFCQNSHSVDFSQNPGLFLNLLTMKALVTPTEEENALRRIKYEKYCHRFDNTVLRLTILPTTACNFDCTYCYQGSSKAGVFMNNATEDKIIDFVRSFPGIQRLHVFWYGGEPLLGWDVILRLSQKLQKIQPNYAARLITNGYLLNEDKTMHLEELRISQIQVTLDGSAEVHDQRRMLVGGGGTFATIVSHLERLMNVENWNGSLHIRINVDETNHDKFASIYHSLSERLQGRVSIFPGFLTTSAPDEPNRTYRFDRKKQAQFILDQYYRHGIKAPRYYPAPNRVGCTADYRNSFVIDPAGELYKCWDHIGKKNKACGSIHAGNPDTTPTAAYIFETDPFNDPLCRDCLCLPLCIVCPDLRLLSKTSDNPGDSCTLYKDNLPQFLEIHYELTYKNNTPE